VVRFALMIRRRNSTLCYAALTNACFESIPMKDKKNDKKGFLTAWDWAFLNVIIYVNAYMVLRSIRRRDSTLFF
jgi:hypothetical protein